MTDVNRAMLEMVLSKLGDVREQLVFLGGAVAGLLASNPAAEPIRETDDVDCIVEVGASRLEYHAIESRLFELGWQPGSAKVPADPMCRFRHGTLVVDVMPDHPDVLGFASIWGRAAIPHATHLDVGPWTIRVISAPFFLATKLEAFLNRGDNDYLASHDLEDVVIVVDGRPEILEEVERAPANLRTYLGEQLHSMWPRLMSETLPGALRSDSAKLRLVERRLDAIRQLKP